MVKFKGKLTVLGGFTKPRSVLVLESNSTWMEFENATKEPGLVDGDAVVITGIHSKNMVIYCMTS